MALINVPDIQNLDPATPELWNSRFAEIVNAINGGLDADNLAALAVTTSRLAALAVTTAKIADAAVTPPKWTNPYKFRVRRVAAQTTTAGAFTKIAFDTEDYDTNNNFASGSYTAPVNGFYHFNARAAGNGNTQLIIALYKNGAFLERGGHQLINAVQGVIYSNDVELDAGDVMDIYLFGDAAVAIEVGTGCYFSGHLISET